MLDARVTQAIELMTQFAERTGLSPEGPPRRYLWTDAFAVCNYLALRERTGDDAYLDLALALIDQVHRVLGRHRPDDPRTGWLSGLPEEEGEAHPTRAGLRIGKPLPERGPHEPLDEQLEWDRDGQYFHYLTKWMHALDVAGRATGVDPFDTWAADLAAAAHRGFTYPAHGGARRMRWKMSLDLSRPLVSSMGQHDPLDGLITAVQLARTPHGLVADYAAMVTPETFATADPLGLGGLLADVCRVYQLVAQGAWPDDLPLLEPLIDGARLGLTHYVRTADLEAPADRRLAFRELGLAIGLAGIELLPREASQLPTIVARKLAHLERFARLRDDIEAFWLRPEARRSRTWREHADINDVMLATCLVPTGFLELPAHAGRTPAPSRTRTSTTSAADTRTTPPAPAASARPSRTSGSAC